MDRINKEKSVIPDNQFGFQHKLSTAHAITKLTSDLNRELSFGDMVGACLIDLEKAFDSVWIKGLLYKLKKKKVSHKSLPCHYITHSRI